MPAYLKPYRDYDEHDVINGIFSYSGTIPVNRGTFVKVVSGWRSDGDPLEMIGSVGASYANTVSERWGTGPCVGVANSGDTPLGILLWDVKEVDENGEQLKFNPRKAAEMHVALSGQAVPIVTKGLFLMSGITGVVAAGAKLYLDNEGVAAFTQKGSNVQVGKALGPKDGDGYVLVKLEL